MINSNEDAPHGTQLAEESIKKGQNAKTPLLNDAACRGCHGYTYTHRLRQRNVPQVLVGLLLTWVSEPVA